MSSIVALRAPIWAICQTIDYKIFFCKEIEVEICWPKNRLSAELPQIFIQKIQMANLTKAFDFIDYILATARLITKLNIKISVMDTTILNSILEKLIWADNIELEKFYIRRSYMGQKIPIIAELIKKHSNTLKIIGKIGINEAIRCFNSTMNLERLSLMNFDLVENGDFNSKILHENTNFYLRRLAHLGAKFEHLSYTTYSGFEITKNPVLLLLKNAQTQSLRLSMQKGLAIFEPIVVRPLLYHLKTIELIGCMEISIKTISNFQLMFPALEFFDFKKLDLETGVYRIYPTNNTIIKSHFINPFNEGLVAAAC